LRDSRQKALSADENLTLKTLTDARAVRGGTGLNRNYA